MTTVADTEPEQAPEPRPQRNVPKSDSLPGAPWWSTLVYDVFLGEHWRSFIRAVILILLLLAVLYEFGTTASAITGAGATAVAVTKTIMSRREGPATDK